MTDFPDEFERLRRFALFHQGQFSLGLARVNDPRQRNEVIARLEEALKTQGIQAVHLDLSNRHPENLRQALQSTSTGRALLQKPRQAALLVTGMEHLIETTLVPGGRPPFAAALNAERDLLRSTLPIPVILFLTDLAMDRLDISAPDFFDWYSTAFHFQTTGVSAARTEPPTGSIFRQQQIYSNHSSPKSLEHLEALRRRIETDPARREELAALLLIIGRSYASLPGFSDRQLAVSYLKQGARLFHELKDEAREAACLLKLAEVYYWIDNYSQAIQHLQQALTYYNKIENWPKAAACQQRLGDVYIQLSETKLAEQHYQQALTLYQKQEQASGAANCIRSLGDVARLKGNFFQAERRYRAALPLYRAQKDRLGEANCIQNMGDILLHQGQHRQAQIRYHEALEIYRKISNPLGKANCLQGLGHAARLQGNLSEAQKRYTEAMQAYHAIGYRLGETACLENLGDLARRREEYDESEKCYLEALSAYRSLHNKLGEANVFYGLGELFFQKGELQTAWQSFQRAQAIYRQVGARLGEANTLAAQGAIALLDGQEQTAGQALQQACQIYLEIGDRYSVAVQTGNYGWLLYERGKLSEARSYLWRAAEYLTVLGLHEQAERHQRAGEAA